MKPALTRAERARVELIVTAERLFAERGLDGVSLRQIAAEAGYANPATVQYHFGTKEGLWQAIVDHRLPGIEQRRSELFDELGDDDLASLVEVMARPLLELPDDARYLSFLGQLLVDIDEHDRVYRAAVEREGSRRIRRAVDRILADESHAVRAMRLQFVTLLMVHAIANRRARVAAGRDNGLREADFERELFTAMAAVLAPAVVARWSEQPAAAIGRER
jgi:AcrR family transcriptional regulator